MRNDKATPGPTLAPALLGGDDAVVPNYLSESDFERLHESRQGVEYVKLVVVRSDLTTPEDDRIYFFDPRVYPLHIEFARRTHLVDPTQVQEVQTETWTSPDRRFFFANLSRYGAEGEKVYVLEMFEQDKATANLVAEVVKLVGKRSFLGSELVYKPNALSQASLSEALEALNVRMVDNKAIIDVQPYAVLNRGRPVVGQLRVIESLDPMEVQFRAYEPTDIVVLQTVPNDITRVSGIITTQPSTPLAHVNLRAMTWGIPNVMMRDILQYIWAEGMEDAWVHLSVDDGGIPQIRFATAAETARVLEDRVYQVAYRLPPADLEAKSIRPLHSLRSPDVLRVGAKAANLGEMTHLLRGISPGEAQYAIAPPHDVGQAPHQLSVDFIKAAVEPTYIAGYADLLAMNPKARAALIFEGVEIPPGVVIPFGLYEALLSHPENAQLKADIDGLLADENLDENAFERRERLMAVREAMERAHMPPEMRAQILDAVHAELGEGDVFVRSSTNSEDLLGFNGAGLYDSFGPIRGDDAMIEALMRVWASVFNLRAYEARRDFGIDHGTVYPAALIQKAIKPDLAGVMVTRDLFRGEGTPRVYINANPGPGANVAMTGMQPEQVYVDLKSGEVERTSLSESASGVLLSDKMARRLALVGLFLEAHFTEIMGEGALPQDVEWLLVGEQIHLVQSRPYAPSL